MAGADNTHGAAGALVPVLAVFLLEHAAGAEGAGAVELMGALLLFRRLRVDEAEVPQLGRHRALGHSDRDLLGEGREEEVGEDVLGVAADALAPGAEPPLQLGPLAPFF